MNRFFGALLVCATCCTRLFATADSSFVIFPLDYWSNGISNDATFGDPAITGKPIVSYAFGCGGHETTYKDSIVPSGANFCKRILRIWTVKHNCVSSTIVKTHKQTLLLNDNSTPTILNTPKVTVTSSGSCAFSLKIDAIEAKDFSGIGSISAQLLHPGSSVPFQTRTVFPAKMVLDSTYAGKMMFIRYIVTDNCGNFTSNDVSFQIPTKVLFLTCKNQIEKEMGSSGKIIVEAKEFINQIFENCQINSDALIKLEVTHLKGSCFSSTPLSMLKIRDTISCLGNQSVKIWVKSKTGAESFCFSKLNILNTNKIPNIPVCQHIEPNPIDICLEVKTPKGQPINAKVDFEGEDVKPINGFNCMKTTDCYTNIWLHFAKIDAPTNGVSTLDLTLISKHILGIQPITTPYGLLAADVNKDGKISTADLVELRKIILGIKTYFVDGESWRFYDEKYKPSPMIMMSEYKSVTKKIIAVKIGDIDGNATPN